MVALLISAGCVTGTAHRLPLAGNPLAQQAASCEATCRLKLEPVSTQKCLSYSGSYNPADDNCSFHPEPDRSAYAACLDNCPGAMVTDGASCPDPPIPGMICEKTYKANPGGIAGGVAATAGIGLTIVVVASVAALLTGPGILLILLIH